MYQNKYVHVNTASVNVGGGSLWQCIGRSNQDNGISSCSGSNGCGQSVISKFKNFVNQILCVIQNYHYCYGNYKQKIDDYKNNISSEYEVVYVSSKSSNNKISKNTI